jgi:hypothetical protein
MRQRCTNSKHPKFKHYGGRGIKVCPQWENFAQFERDVGPHPGKGWTFDRKDNNDGYHKGNVRWASYKTQNRNRNYTKLTAEDAALIRQLYQRRTKKQLSADFGVSWSQIHRIIRNEAWA